MPVQKHGWPSHIHLLHLQSGTSPVPRPLPKPDTSDCFSPGWKTPEHPTIMCSSERGKQCSPMMLCISYHFNSSSTAQGGGGSFKNRKPIGEVGCCESGMAERSHCWSERWLISLTISLSFSDYLPTYLPIYLPMYLSIYLSIYLSTYLSI